MCTNNCGVTIANQENSKKNVRKTVIIEFLGLASVLYTKNPASWPHFRFKDAKASIQKVVTVGLTLDWDHKGAFVKLRRYQPASGRDF